MDNNENQQTNPEESTIRAEIPVFSAILSGIENCQRWITVVFFITLIAVVFFQVVNRYLIGIPVRWTADLAVTLFIWVGFLTASTSVRKMGHFRMVALVELFRGTMGRRLLELFSLLVILIVSLLLGYHGFRMAARGWFEMSAGLGIPMFWIFVSIPIASTTASLFCIERILLELLGRSDQDVLDAGGSNV